MHATRHLGEAVAVGGHRVQDGEGIDGTTRAFKDTLLAFGKVQLDETEFESDVVARELEGGLYDLAGTGGGDDGDGLGAAAEVHGGEEAREAEEVVAVKVRDEDGGQRLELDVVLADTVLRTLGAVNQYFETIDIEYLGATAAYPCGKGGART